MKYRRRQPRILKIVEMSWIKSLDKDVITAIDEHGNHIIIGKKHWNELYEPIEGSVVMFRDKELEIVTLERIEEFEDDKPDMVYYLSRWNVPKCLPLDKFHLIFELCGDNDSNLVSAETSEPVTS